MTAKSYRRRAAGPSDSTCAGGGELSNHLGPETDRTGRNRSRGRQGGVRARRCAETCWADLRELLEGRGPVEESLVASGERRAASGDRDRPRRAHALQRSQRPCPASPSSALQPPIDRRGCSQGRRFTWNIALPPNDPLRLPKPCGPARARRGTMRSRHPRCSRRSVDAAAPLIDVPRGTMLPHQTIRACNRREPGVDVGE